MPRALSPEQLLPPLQPGAESGSPDGGPEGAGEVVEQNPPPNEELAAGNCANLLAEGGYSQPLERLLPAGAGAVVRCALVHRVVHQACLSTPLPSPSTHLSGKKWNGRCILFVSKHS